MGRGQILEVFTGSKEGEKDYGGKCADRGQILKGGRVNRRRLGLIGGGVMDHMGRSPLIGGPRIMMDTQVCHFISIPRDEDSTSQNLWSPYIT